MAIFEIGIMGRVTWNLHSLNNEGTVGNVTEPRTVVLASGEKTDGISGEMLKHIHAYNVWLLQDDKSLLCEACQRFHPQKAHLNPLVTKGKLNEIQAMGKAIETCILCDLHGFLVEKPTISRPSTVEFGWALGLPNRTYRDIHIHARHSMEGLSSGGAEKSESNEEAGEKQVTAQMIYHRPTRSGVYAFVSVFQPWRIGLNEVNYTYAIDDGQREKRYQLAINGYKATFMRTEGAMTSTRLPHVESMEGVIAISEVNFPAPVISPLRESFLEEMENIAKQQNGLSLKKFANVVEFCGVMNELLNGKIYSLTMPAKKTGG